MNIEYTGLLKTLEERRHGKIKLKNNQQIPQIFFSFYIQRI